MKRLVCILILLVLLPVSSFATSFGMTGLEFLKLYNLVPAPLGSPFVSLDRRDSFLTLLGSNGARYYADSAKTVAIVFVAIDGVPRMPADLSRIIVVSDREHFPGFIATAKRVLTVITDQHLTLTDPARCITNTIATYYETNCSGDETASSEVYGNVSLHSMESDENVFLIIQ